MNILKGFGIALQIPAWIILFGSVIAGFYAYANNISGITIKVPIILLAIVICYLLGRFIAKLGKNKEAEVLFAEMTQPPAKQKQEKEVESEGENYDKYN